MMGRELLIVCDLDDTLANSSERRERAGNEPEVKDPAAYQRWLDILQAPGALLQDRVINPVAAVVRSLRAYNPDAQFVYLTGRSENYREETERWLSENQLPDAPIIMRRSDEYNSPFEYKRSAMQTLRALYKHREILVLDDDSAGDCSTMYQQFGAVHLKVLRGAK